mgnify:CR=1 FL=1
MADVSVSELRANLQQHLARVQAGARLRVTSRGRVIAEIGPPLPAAEETVAALKRLRGSVLGYDSPLEPAFGADEWEALR